MKRKFKRRIWTEAEILVIQQEYPNRPTKEVAELIGRSVSQVYQAADRFGVNKSAEYLKEILTAEGKRLSVAGANSRFNKGHISHNKGQKMSSETYEKVRGSMFTKGHRPKNYLPVGSERVNKDGFMERKIADPNKWAAVHRLNWIEKYGEIPACYNIIFKDGNRLNAEPSNLKKVSKRENMERNTIQRFPPELISTIKILSKLKKQIHEKQN